MPVFPYALRRELDDGAVKRLSLANGCEKVPNFVRSKTARDEPSIEFPSKQGRSLRPPEKKLKLRAFQQLQRHGNLLRLRAGAGKPLPRRFPFLRPGIKPG